MNLQDNLSYIKVPQLWWSQFGTPGIIRAEGNEIFDLIHRLSTNACMNLQHNIGKQTILTNEKGRIIDIITLINRNDHTLILTSKGNEQNVIAWVKKYIIMESIRFSIITDDCEVVTIHGPESLDFISQFIGGDFLTLPMHSAMESASNPMRFAIRCMPIHELQYLIIDAKGSRLMECFKEISDIPELDEISWNRERILSGHGIYSHEWSDSYNPLEAGLLHLIDFKKGCYIGQEVIARLDSYSKVNKRLIGICSTHPFTESDIIFAGEEKIGIITSISNLNDATIGLAYIRSEHAYDETKVAISHEGKKIEATLHVLPMRK
jgi:folate-binding protein YgfZ